MFPSLRKPRVFVGDDSPHILRCFDDLKLQTGKINMGIPTGMGIEPTVRYHLVGGFFKLSTDMLWPIDPELPAKRVRQLTLSGDVSWTLEIVGYFASKEWGYMKRPRHPWMSPNQAMIFLVLGYLKVMPSTGWDPQIPLDSWVISWSFNLKKFYSSTILAWCS